MPIRAKVDRMDRVLKRDSAIPVTSEEIAEGNLWFFELSTGLEMNPLGRSPVVDTINTCGCQRPRQG